MLHDIELTKFNGLKHVGLEINEADCMTFLLTCTSRLCQGLVVHSTAVTLPGYDGNNNYSCSSCIYDDISSKLT